MVLMLEQLYGPLALAASAKPKSFKPQRGKPGAPRARMAKIR